MSNTAEIGVFGGSGFYSLIDDPREIWVETPYGAPSDKIALEESVPDKKSEVEDAQKFKKFIEELKPSDFLD